MTSTAENTTAESSGFGGGFESEVAGEEAEGYEEEMRELRERFSVLAREKRAEDAMVESSGFGGEGASEAAGEEVEAEGEETGE